VKVSGPGQTHAAQGGERREAAGPWARELRAELLSYRPRARAAARAGHGSPRNPPPPPLSPPNAAPCATPAAPRAGRGQLFPSDSTRSVGLPCPTAPPLLALPVHPSLVCTTPRQKIATLRPQIPSLLNILFIFLKDLKSDGFAQIFFFGKKKSVSR
jgi:hypothetical protein